MTAGRRVLHRPQASIIALAMMCGAALGGLSLPAAGFAQAQSDTQGLVNRLDRLERDLSTMQRMVARGEPPAMGAASQVIASPALRDGAGAGGGDDLLAKMQVRISQLETQIRALTGQVEESNYRSRVLAERLDKMQADADFRFRDIEQRLTGGGPLAQNPPAANAPEALVPQKTQPGVMGTMSEADLKKFSQAPVQIPPTQNPQTQAGSDQMAASPKEAYEAAFALLQKQDFAAAEAAFKGFLAKWPKDALASNAHFWLGETHYVRQDYPLAARSFAESYKSFPKGNKAPDSLLKLGMTFAQLGQNNEACVSFGRLNTEFPAAPDLIKRRLVAEKQKAGCK